jgi:A/G-specific adenine glycosylase
MSIAFNRRYPALDGNARRVLQRLFGFRDEKTIREFAAILVACSRPGAWNQALMELGARICLPREPGCEICPVLAFCSFPGRNSVPPAERGKSKSRRVDWPLAVIQRNGKFLLHRRSEGGLLRGLWEIPGGERKRGESLEGALKRHLQPLRVQLSAGPIGVIRHAITYRRIRAPVYRCALPKALPLPDRDWLWVDPGSLSRRPVSSLTRKAIELFEGR